MRQRILRALGVALILLLAFEGAVRFVAERVPEPPEWHYIGVDELVEAMGCCARTGSGATSS